VSLLLSLQFVCSEGKTCCNRDGTFQLGRDDLLLHTDGGECVMYCHLLSKETTRTETVMEAGTISYGVILLDSK
jgi:hypothetical protein